MKIKYLWFLIVLFVNFTHSQTNNDFLEIDSKISKIPDSLTYSTQKTASFIENNFKNDTEKIRAVFIFVASKINYDVIRFKTFLDDTNNANILQFRQTVKTTLLTRQGVCQDYAILFQEIASLLKIKTIVINGLTKHNGQLSRFAHAWCASKIDNNWYIFEPTWGSGYVNNLVFTKKLNFDHFQIEPKNAIKDHMPFDYLMQFLNFPISSLAFADKKLDENKPTEFFDFETELTLQEQQNDAKKNTQLILRIEKNGAYTKLEKEYLSVLKKNENTYIALNNFEKINQINKILKTAVLDLNSFISFKNKQFKPNISDENLMLMLQKLQKKIIESGKSLQLIDAEDVANANNIKMLNKSLISLSERIETEMCFVNIYLKKNTIDRIQMFKKKRQLK